MLYVIGRKLVEAKMLLTCMQEPTSPNFVWDADHLQLYDSRQSLQTKAETVLKFGNKPSPLLYNYYPLSFNISIPELKRTEIENANTVNF
jgi:hypothetical protein